MAAMRFEQVQRFILAKKIFWGYGHFKSLFQLSSLLFLARVASQSHCTLRELLHHPNFFKFLSLVDLLIVTNSVAYKTTLDRAV